MPGENEVVEDVIVEDDVVVVDELPPSGEKEEVDTGGKSVKDILAENEALRQQADQAGAIQRGITDLGSILQKQQAAPQMPAKAPGETDEEYKARFNKEFFGTDSYAVLQDAIKREVTKIVDPKLAAVSQSVSAVNRSLYKDDFVYKTYKDEVEQMVASVPAEQRNHPGLLDWAIKQVKANHVEDIIELKLNERLAAVPAVQQPVGSAKATFVEGGGTRSTVMERKQTPITKAEAAVADVYIQRGLSRDDAIAKVLRDRRK
jgi:hypothetical protein